MLSVKMLKPYYVKEDRDCVRLVLAYQYFSLLLDNKLYQFVPLESREIRINRETHKVENEDDIFVFQKGKDYHRVSLSDLIKQTDFLTHLHSIVQPYLAKTNHLIELEESEKIVEELERSNLYRLIDKALDERDYDRLSTLYKYL
ncbi:IDEAL domain-containing protein [Aquibacillus sp. 3ASR75-11]|uniref:IDEAL domain-containing protein n=1 Tax=Terrihalobacillus insolitus TaxID=2950438 RepID=A0A9X3WQQ3_9BACI|nr:IDEAL domain-containing protein [Terrihalobacillus insolitus]MDC3412188.1 IDEAL domain-containing protein [Terrihalobacillus insolitus]MDC3423118.1 IDEAL domain-containing protein [Terrihalobacillus insolitus]